MTGGENGWGEYSRLVLKELETLATGIQALRQQIQELKIEISEIKAREDKVQELSQWKSRVDEVASPSQLQTAVKDIDDLKTFKTKAITSFVVVQFIMGCLMAILNFMQ